VRRAVLDVAWVIVVEGGMQFVVRRRRSYDAPEPSPHLALAEVVVVALDLPFLVHGRVPVSDEPGR